MRPLPPQMLLRSLTSLPEPLFRSLAPDNATVDTASVRSSPPAATTRPCCKTNVPVTLTHPPPADTVPRQNRVNGDGSPQQLQPQTRPFVRSLLGRRYALTRSSLATEPRLLAPVPIDTPRQP